MPTDLTGSKIKDSYGQLLHVDGGVTSTLKTVYDGDGTATGLKVSTTGIDPGAMSIELGTANGVAYLNGSKVLTTGSALTFDGTTTLGLTVAGTGSVLNGYNVTNGAASGIFKVTGSTYSYRGVGSNVLWVGGDGNPMYLGTSTDQPVLFGTNAFESMRLTSTGLGIGTSSPGAKLNVSTSGNSVLLNGSGTAANFLRLTSNGADGVLGVESSTGASIVTGGSAYSTVLYTVGATPLQLGTNSSIKATLDSSGNLGLGVTPSAWLAGYRALEMPQVALFSGAGGGGFLYGNAYLNTSGTPTYKVTGQAATALNNQGGGFQFSIAPSGTAGNAISFTQAMTLDNSGNWFLGTTSGSDKANIAGNATLTASQPAYGLVDSGNSNYKWILQNLNGAVRFYDITANTERMRIDSSGNLLVGATSAPVTNRVNGFYWNRNGYLQIREQASQSQWSIDSTSGVVVYLYSDNGSSGVYAGAISVNGNTAAYSSVSDYRLKENVQPMTGALDKIAKLNPVTFNFKNGGQESQGFIAHELQAVVPDCVTGEKDAVDAEGNPVYQGIDTSFLVGILTKAIQELKAELDATKAEIAALKGV